MISTAFLIYGGTRVLFLISNCILSNSSCVIIGSWQFSTITHSSLGSFIYSSAEGFHLRFYVRKLSNYFSNKSIEKRKEQENNDKILRDNILKAYNFKGRKKGVRQVKMTLEGQFDIVYNLKRICRIMKKYSIICPIRMANPYRKIIKATLEHSTLPNLLNKSDQFDGTYWTE